MTTSGSTFYGGDSTVYDTGTATVTLTSSTGATLATTAPVSWGSTSTGATLSSALMSAINTAAGSYVTASLDDTSGSVNLTSVATGSLSDTYGISVTTTDTTAASHGGYYAGALPNTGFSFDSSSTAGAEAASASYGPVYTYIVPTGGYAPNGNLLAHSDSVMGDWAFQYDTLNRLTVAAPADNAPSSYVSRLGCFDYDGFGNRTLEVYTITADCSSALATRATYNSQNQVTYVSQTAPVAYSAPSGFTYDLAGNVIADGQNQYAYDGEGRLCAVKNSTGAITGYLYNAEGLRTAASTLTTLSCNLTSNGFSTAHLTKQYLLDLGGDQVTELNGTGAWQHSNVWAGSHLDATYDAKGLHFHLADPLGTRRIQTNVLGQVENSFQSLPFGDGYLAISAGLSTSDDATEHHFTGKEHDVESGNDYFEARYYSGAVARMLSPDPLGGKLANPQSLNRYAYALNNPLVNTDPTGMYVCDDSTECDSKFDKDFAASLSSARADINASTSMSGEELLNAKNALDAYGEKGVDNGVNVKADNSLDSGATMVAGSLGKITSDNRAGQQILVRFPDALLKGDVGPDLVAHEGSHVRDGAEWVRSGFSNAKNPTKYQSENRAYHIQYNVLQSEPGVCTLTPDGYWQTFNIGGVSVVPGLPFSEFLPGLQDMLRTNSHYGADYTPGSKVLTYKKGSVLPE